MTVGAPRGLSRFAPWSVPGHLVGGPDRHSYRGNRGGQGRQQPYQRNNELRNQQDLYEIAVGNYNGIQFEISPAEAHIQVLRHDLIQATFVMKRQRRQVVALLLVITF
jgi:hypothetical protein